MFLILLCSLLLPLLQKTEQAALMMAEDDDMFPPDAAFSSTNSSVDSLSDSGSDTEAEGEADLESQKNDLTIISSQHLSLVDDDVPLLVPHHEELFGEIDGMELYQYQDQLSFLCALFLSFRILCPKL